MGIGTEQLIEKKAIKLLTKEAARVKENLEGYLEDLELYSNPEFWEAIRETAENKGKTFSSAKKFLNELDH